MRYLHAETVRAMFSFPPDLERQSMAPNRLNTQFNDACQDGFLPTEGGPAWELAEHRRFFGEVERLRALCGSDGRRIFVFPTALSFEDPAWRQLDTSTLKRWLEHEGYDSPTLHWYLNYCCRDDHGAR